MLNAQEETAAVLRPATTPAAITTPVEAASADAGKMKIAAGDLRGAIETYDEVLIRDPRNTAALLSRSETYVMLGEHHRAETDLWNILGVQQKGPYAERAFLKLGENALAANDPRTADILFDRYVRIAPEDALAWCKRGMARMALHQDEEALDDLEKAIQLDPQLDVAHVNKAMILLRMGFRQEGCAALQFAHDLGDLSTEELLLIHCDR
jgi:tetratricopeptide (TPR) repeat protein